MAKITNPIIPSDYPDVDVIRVEDTYYMVSTTMHFMPGAVILRSYDLGHWETISHIYTELTDAIRTYIKDRFGFNALEMTSSEIIDKLLEMNDKEAISDLKLLFQTADLVKFAKHNPQMNENDANLINAIDFINETKQLEEENQKPQPTEITIIEKRSLRVKAMLICGIALLSAALIGTFIYIGLQLYNLFV